MASDIGRSRCVGSIASGRSRGDRRRCSGRTSPRRRRRRHVSPGGAVRSTRRLPHLRAQGDDRDRARRLDGDADTTARLVKGADGLWEGTTEPLVADFYSYSFTVDGVRTLDPRNALIKQGITQRRQHVPRAGRPMRRLKTPLRRAARRHPRGLVSRRPRSADSGACTSTRHRATTAARTAIPCCTCCTAAATTTRAGARLAAPGFIVDNLLASGKVRPLIVVMPNGSLPRPADFPTTPPGAAPTPEALAASLALQDRFVSELMTDVVPFVER